MLPNNIVEPTRVVACRSIRGQHYAPLMLTASLLQIYDDKYESLLGTVNADAIQPMKHYTFFMPTFRQISVNKFPVNEFITGRYCHAFIAYIGTTERERDKFVLTTLLPCAMLYKAMQWRDRFRGNT